MRRRHNLVETTLGADLSAVATSITFTSALTEGGVNIATIANGDVIPLTIGGPLDTKEVVHLTAYTAGALTGTILREPTGENTNAVSHVAGEPVSHSPTALDFIRMPVLVAASDSSPEEVAAADFVCDGVADEVTIALAVAEALTRNGIVDFSSGSYYFDSALSITSTAPLIFRGPDGSSFTRNIGDPDSRAYFVKQTAGNFSLINLSVFNARLTLKNITLYNDTSESISAAAIDISNSFARLTLVGSEISYYGVGSGAISPHDNCTIQILNSTIESDDACITQSIAAMSLVASDSLFYSDVAASIFSLTNMSALTMIIHKCNIDGDFSIDGSGLASRVLFKDCLVGSYGGDHAISDVAHVEVFGCEFEASGQNNALKITNADRGIVQGNTIIGAGQHGIWVVDSDKIVIENNLIQDVGTDTDATYSGIILDGDTNNCLVQNNKVMTDGAGNLPLYGIRVDDSTCDNNTVVNNDLRTSAKTAGNEFSDAGTGTVAGLEPTALTGWLQDNVAASQTAVALALPSGRTEIPMPASGYVTGIAVYSNAARVAGTLTVEATINGTGTGLTAVLDGTNTQTKATRQGNSADAFTEGQRIGVKITTDGSWSPTTADIDVAVLVTQNTANRI